jgi:adenylate cyclase
LRAGAQRIAACADLNALLAESLACLSDGFDVRQAMLLVFDPGGSRLYTVASRGYEVSGVGSEIPVGAGVIGVAARERAPIRINHMTTEYAYGRAIRDRALREGLGGMLETEIPLPGLASPRSQLAVPIVAASSLQGVLYVEDLQDGRFDYDDEDALATLASLIGVSMLSLQAAAEASPAAPGHAPDGDPSGADASGAGARGPGTIGPGPGAREDACVETGVPATLRHYRVDDSVFLDDEYLIKGVAGAVLWALARDYVATGRVAFTNRELRLDPRIRLPDVGDNLEARLVLLQRRLAERGACLRLERTGRGRLRLCVDRPLQLVEAG